MKAIEFVFDTEHVEKFTMTDKEGVEIELKIKELFGNSNAWLEIKTDDRRLMFNMDIIRCISIYTYEEQE